jgi:hypothetical protein
MKDRAAALEWLEATVFNYQNAGTLLHTLQDQKKWSPDVVLKTLGRQLVAGSWGDVVWSACIFLDKKQTDTQLVLDEVRRILGGKSVGYGSDSNHLANFFEIGRVFEMHPERVCQMLTYKHVDYLIRAEKRGRICGDEGVVPRVADLFLYSALGQILATLGE